MRFLRGSLLGLGLSLSLWAAPPAEGQTGVTLERILSAPFPSELVAAPVGGAVAWVFNARGARNVWVAEPPDFTGRALTVYSADDGQEIGDLAFTPEGKSVVFVRGGEANKRGEFPNPLSRPEGVEQAIWIVGLDGSSPRKIAQGQAPAVSPRADRVAFVSKDHVWWAPLSGDGKPEEIIQTRGEPGALRWSPDGTRIAFVSDRREHSFVGIFDVSARTVRFMDPSVDHDTAPVWSPDGKRIAFLRILSSRQTRIFRPHREGEPWEIRVADVASGAGRAPFRTATGAGSVYRETVGRDQIFWADGDRLVFPWEKDGWTHLYSVPASGGTPTLLTPGAFDVEDVSPSADRRAVLFSSNQGDTDRRHLWSVSVAGGQPASLSSGTGIEWQPTACSDGRSIAFFRSDARRPPRPAIRLADASSRDLAPKALPPDFPESDLVAPEPVVFTASDGKAIHGQLFLPAGGKAPQRRPAVVFFHGGSRRQMLLGWHYNYYYRNAYAFNQYLASRGFVVLSVNYRSGIGYGMEFREALDYGASGASEFADVVGAGLYLRSRPDVDPTRIGLWGGSYGGYLTALGLARASDLFAAGVDLHGVHDWNVVIKNFEAGYDPEKQRDAARLAFDSSPIAYVKSWRSPVLLIHGDDDRNVPFSETVDIAEPLRRQGVEVEQLIFPDEIHDFLVHEHWLEAYRAAADFLERRLKGAPTRPAS
ncbi:MAG: prolyl oligopeptidase family serine peptidase [Acidobacteriota bacterium]